MEYPPEWKIYLWKKLLMNNEGFEKGAVTVADFMFFSNEEQYSLILQKLQRQIDSVQYQYNAALAKQRAARILDNSSDPLVANEYFNFHPTEILAALLELMDSKPHILTITTRLDKKYIARYRQSKKTYEVQQQRKHLGSLGSGHYVPYKPNPNFMNDPYCALGKTIYEKTEADEVLTSEEFRSLAGVSHTAVHDCLVMNLKINKPALNAKLDAHLDDFAAGNLMPPHGVLYFDASLQQEQVNFAIQAMVGSFGVKNLLVTPERVAHYAGWAPGDQKHYRILESILSLEKLGSITVHDFRKSEVIISLLGSSTAMATPSAVDEVRVQTKHGQLILNKRTGDFEYSKVKGNLNPTSKEFKILLRLITSKNCQASYAELIGDSVSKDSKRILGFVMRNLKIALGILPSAAAVNEDVIENVRNLAYKLVI